EALRVCAPVARREGVAEERVQPVQRPDRARPQPQPVQGAARALSGKRGADRFPLLASRRDPARNPPPRGSLRSEERDGRDRDRGQQSHDHGRAKRSRRESPRPALPNPAKTPAQRGPRSISPTYEQPRWPSTAARRRGSAPPRKAPV